VFRISIWGDKFTIAPRGDGTGFISLNPLQGIGSCQLSPQGSTTILKRT